MSGNEDEVLRKQLPIHDDLVEGGGSFPHQFCAPVFIADQFFGMTMFKPEKVIPSGPEDLESPRNGTLTFVSYKGELFAFTCTHIVEALENRNILWRKEKERLYGNDPGFDAYHLFTPVGLWSIHFNFTFAKLTDKNTGASLDLAGARISEEYLSALGRTAIAFRDKGVDPRATGIASGYMEEQRVLRGGKSELLMEFAPLFCQCVSSMQIGDGRVFLHDEIENPNGVDWVSGMSGGPIFWSTEEDYGLLGITFQGSNIKPSQDGLHSKDSISIFGEIITEEKMDHWIAEIGPLAPGASHTKKIHVPEGMRSKSKEGGE